MQLLSGPEPTIPSHWYFDADHYQRELKAIWYRQWVCVGREEALARPGDYLTTKIGDQGIIVTRTAITYGLFDLCHAGRKCVS